MDVMLSALQKVEEITRNMPHTWYTPSILPFVTIIISILGILSLIVTIFSVKNKYFGLGLFLMGFIFGIGLIMYAYR